MKYIELNTLDEQLDKLEQLQASVREFFSFLDRTDESESGREFHPVYISNCRALWHEPLAKALAKMRELSNE